jgi:hypothetical protein
MSDVVQIVINDKHDVHASLKLFIQNIVAHSAEVSLHSLRTTYDVRIWVVLLVRLIFLVVYPYTAER